MPEAVQQQQQQQQVSVQQGQEAVQQQQQQKTFFDSLSEDIRTAYPGLAKKNFTDVNALAKSYGDLEKAYSSADKIAIPTDGRQDSFNAVMNRLGRPETFNPQDYAFNPVKGAPAELAPNSPFMQRMTKIMHHAGLTPNQARGLIAVAGKILAQQAGERKQVTDASRINGVGTIKKLWGKNTQANLKAASIAGNRLVPGVQKVIEQAGLQFNPTVMEFMRKVGEMIADDNTMGIPGGARALGGAPSPDVLEAKAREITRNMTKNRDLTEEQRQKMRGQASKLYAAAASIRNG